MEIIVVDDGSKDKTLSVVTESVSKTDIKVKIFSDKWRGLGAARQTVVDNTYSDYILWVDGDAVIPKDFVRKQVECMEQNPYVGIAGCKVKYKTDTLVADLENLSAIVTGVYNSVFRVKTIKAVGGFDENIKGADEDTDILYRIIEDGWKITINKEASLYHGWKRTLRDLCKREFWSGYGAHYVYHKHKRIFRIMRHQVPFLWVVVGFQHSLRAYELTHQKKAFLIPFLCFFKGISWLFGFAKAHIDHYVPPKNATHRR